MYLLALPASLDIVSSVALHLECRSSPVHFLGLCRVACHLGQGAHLSKGVGAGAGESHLLHLYLGPVPLLQGWRGLGQSRASYLALGRGGGAASLALLLKKDV